MAFHVVHGDRGHTQRGGQCASGRGPYQQGADQARPHGVGHGVDVVAVAVGLFQALVQQRHQFAHVVARGDFRHNATVFGMYVGL